MLIIKIMRWHAEVIVLGLHGNINLIELASNTLLPCNWTWRIGILFWMFQRRSNEVSTNLLFGSFWLKVTVSLLDSLLCLSEILYFVLICQISCWFGAWELVQTSRIWVGGLWVRFLELELLSIFLFAVSFSQTWEFIKLEFPLVAFTSVLCCRSVSTVHSGGCLRIPVLICRKLELEQSLFLFVWREVNILDRLRFNRKWLGRADKQLGSICFWPFLNESVVIYASLRLRA